MEGKELEKSSTTPNPAPVCVVCKSSNPPFMCRRCCAAHYCTTACQLRDWPRHQMSCVPEKAPRRHHRRHHQPRRPDSAMKTEVERQPEEKDIPISRQDQIEINLGESETLALASNPTTGNSYFDEKRTAGIEVVSSRYVLGEKAKAGVTGAGGHHEWLITAKRPGRHWFRVTYGQKWDRSTWTIFEFPIEVLHGKQKMPKTQVGYTPAPLVGGDIYVHLGKKLSKQQAGYTPAYPAIRCESCPFFIRGFVGHNACAIVDGDIEAHGCCNLWLAPSAEIATGHWTPNFDFVSGAQANQILTTD